MKHTNDSACSGELQAERPSETPAHLGSISHEESTVLVAAERAKRSVY